ncbi:MAG TPA: pantoate--beta-alanine ligase [Acidimicrobiales bacterium]|nr:pantoate--beta-alanine ligase [Acidimicrobiales bacterium]
MSTAFVDVPPTQSGPRPTAPPRAPVTTYRPRVIETIAVYSETLDAIRMSGRTVGVVPTMGALHEGHRSLIRRAAAECDVVAVSIFVNPTQFGDPSDLANYPRSLDADLEAIAAAGGRLVFAPSVAEMYPDPPGVAPTSVTVSALGAQWEGAARPGHFDGVATVVVKLLSAAGRCRSYFGEKDFQQLAVVTRVARDLALPTQVIGCPTVRDHDGLALSSRNARLSPDERRQALVLSRALRAGAALLSEGCDDPSEVEACMEQLVSLEPGADLDYAAVVYADDLERPRSLVTDRPLRLLIAASVGPVRLIDNLDPRRGR